MARGVFYLPAASGRNPDFVYAPASQQSKQVCFALDLRSSGNLGNLFSQQQTRDRANLGNPFQSWKYVPTSSEKWLQGPVDVATGKNRKVPTFRRFSPAPSHEPPRLLLQLILSIGKWGEAPVELRADICRRVTHSPLSKWPAPSHEPPRFTSSLNPFNWKGRFFCGVRGQKVCFGS